MNSRRILAFLTIASLAGFFLFFNLQSVKLYFDSDDLYALYFAWSKPMLQVIRENLYLWKGEFRPFGAFFYRGLFALAGFHPRPFRIVALLVCFADMGLCFWLTRLVSGSERLAALACLLFAFQERMIEVWWRTTVIFDTLCFTFAYLVVGLYIKARRNGEDLSFARVGVLLALFVCALDSKEFAVVVPVFLVSWELLFNAQRLRAFLRSRAAWMIVAMGALTIVYTYGKLHAGAAMVSNPTYTPQYTWGRFSETWGEYLHDLLFLTDRPSGVVCVGILAGMLAVAALLRSRVLAFSWVIAFFGVLPVTFAPARGGYEIYFSWIGWVLFAAGLIVAIEDVITRNAPQWRTAAACGVFAAVAMAYGGVNYRFLKSEDKAWLYASPDSIRVFTKDMLAMHRRFPPGSRAMFLEDGIGWGEYTPLFIMRVLYDNPTMVVDRLKQRTSDKPNGWTQYLTKDRTHYDHVFAFDGNHYLEVPSEIAALHGLAVPTRSSR